MVFINDIIEKRGILYSLAPFTDGIKTLKRRLDLVDYTYSDLRLYGSTLTRGGVESILAGNTVSGVQVAEHKLCEAHRLLLSRFSDKLDMKLELDNILIGEFCTILSGKKLPLYREGSPLLYHLDFVPGDDDRISADLAEMFSALKRAENAGKFDAGKDMDFCLKAAAVHMGIVEVYPYSEGLSELAARAAMQYELLRAGYFPVDVGLSESEYNTVTAESIKSGNVEDFAAAIRMAVFKKLHFLIDAVKRGV